MIAYRAFADPSAGRHSDTGLDGKTTDGLIVAG